MTVQSVVKNWRVMASASASASSSSSSISPQTNLGPICYRIGTFPYTNTKCTIAAGMSHVRLLKFQTLEPVRRLECYIDCEGFVNDPTNILTNVSGWACIRITVIRRHENNVKKYAYKINLTMCNTDIIHRDTPSQEFEGLIMLPGNIERLQTSLATNYNLAGLCSAPHHLIMKCRNIVNPLFAESDDDDDDDTVFIN